MRDGGGAVEGCEELLKEVRSRLGVGVGVGVGWGRRVVGYGSG